MPKEPKEPKETEQSKLALAFSVGTVITSNIVGGIIAGYLLDRWLGTDPWLVVAGVVLGTIGAFLSLYRIMSRLSGPENN
ncbi:MAG: AtpZ/AtpI family protein [Blastocatellia bacterium]|nr:AtpZ/AtpI family protein [Blastocatellia bacterium]